MAGSILPGWARDSGVYRPRRCSREHTCPVTNTDPWPCRAGAATCPTFGLSEVTPVPASVRLAGWAVVSGIGACRPVREGEELDVHGLVPAVDQGGRRGARGVGHRPRLVLRQRYPQHEELLLPGQPGGAGGGDDGGPVADPSVPGAVRCEPCER